MCLSRSRGMLVVRSLNEGDESETSEDEEVPELTTA